MFITHEPCSGCRAALLAANIPYEVMKKGPNMTGLLCGTTHVDATLKERGGVYGNFEDNANFTQEIMQVIQANIERPLANYEREALHMIAHKMARIVCGKKTKKDNWHDIAGYAKLAEDLTVDQ
jgi:hypothetical protein